MNFSDRGHEADEHCFVIVPAAWRRRYWLLISALCLYGGWLWLGTSGAGLFALWLAVLRPWHSERFLLRIRPDTVSNVVIVPWLITLHAQGRRVEVFRDELRSRDWRQLCAVLRLAVDACDGVRRVQPAAGRSTSS